MGRKNCRSKQVSENDHDYIPRIRQRCTKKSPNEAGTSRDTLIKKYFNDTIPENEVRSLLPSELAEEYLCFVRECLSHKQRRKENHEQDKSQGERKKNKQTTQRKPLSAEHKENMPMEESDEDENEKSARDKSTKLRRRKDTTKNLLKCLLCNKICQSKSDKQAHYNDHWSKRGYECTHCTKAFDKMPALVSHVSRVHLINKNLSCKVCGQVFRREWLLRSHSLTHTSGRKYSCPVCKRGFTRKRDLFDHISGHVNYNPYKCHECGKRFQMSCYLSLHRKIHLVVRPFKCRYCDVRCVKYSDVETHALLHKENSGVDCIQCNVRVPLQKYALHKINHKRQQNFVCTLCTAKFHAKSTLKDHLKAHKLIKEYKCDVCEVVMQTVSECSNHVCSKSTESTVTSDVHFCKTCNIYVKKRDVSIHNEKHAPQPKSNEEQLKFNLRARAKKSSLWSICDDSETEEATRFSPNDDDDIDDDESQSDDDDSSSSDDGSCSSDDYDQFPVPKTLSSGASVFQKSEPVESESCNMPLNLENGLFQQVGFIESDFEEEDTEDSE